MTYRLIYNIVLAANVGNLLYTLYLLFRLENPVFNIWMFVISAAVIAMLVVLHEWVPVRLNGQPSYFLRNRVSEKEKVAP